jgi:GDP-L-fucose synthase
LANLIKKISGFNGDLYFNKSYPDGVKRRKLDSNKINKLGWKPKVSLKNGLKKYYNYYTRIKA